MFFKRTVVKDMETYIDWNYPKSFAIKALGPTLHIDYIRQRLSQDYSTESGDVVAPEFLETLLPEHVLHDLKRLDWQTCDLQIATAISLRLIWLWDFRCEQYDAHVYLIGDDTIYRRLRGALLYQLDRSARYRPVHELAQELIPLQLPSCDDDISFDLNFQRKLRRSFEDVLNGIGMLGLELRLETDPNAVAGVLHPFDGFCRAYASVAQLLMTREGKPSRHTRSHSSTGYRIEFARPRRSLTLFPVRGKTRGTGINVAYFALKRLQKLWKAFNNHPASYQRFNAEVSAAYQAELDIIHGVLKDNPFNHELYHKSRMLLPRYLYRQAGSRSVASSLDESSRKLQRLIDEVTAMASLRGECIDLSTGSPEFSEWFSEEHLTRYTLVINNLLAATTSSESTPGAKNPSSPDVFITADVKSSQDIIPDQSSAIEASYKMGSTGRPTANVDYETAVRAWWDLSDEMAPKRPTQQDVCDRLAQTGTHIAVRTFRQKVFNWRREGRRWPGPRPDSEAA